MRILHISPSFFPATEYGGPIYSGYSLCNSLAQIPGVELRVLTTDSNGSETLKLKTRVARQGGYDIYYCRRWVRDLSPGLFLRLPSMIKWADIVHLTAVYSPPTIPSLLLSKLFRKPVVWSVRGGLQRWRGSTRRSIKHAWERVCDSLCEKGRVVLHVTSDEEGRDSLQRIRKAEALVIPNGVDVPGGNGARQWRPLNQLRLLYLGRLHPIKGIENLLQALTRLDNKVTLSICGSGSKEYEHFLKLMTHELLLTDRVRFYGHVDDTDKQARFSEADVCVVPSFTENFGMVVAEALAAGIPVIASTGTPWAQLEPQGCGLWVKNDPSYLADAITRISSQPLEVMGRRGREWMDREFTWTSVAQQMMEHYRRLQPTGG